MVNDKKEHTKYEDILISVCIVTYNQEQYIEDAIKGVLSQKTSFQFEIIIGDDCSSDNTHLICSEYKSRYPNCISYHRNIQNIGLLNNYTQTINRAKGKYIAICSGDDYWIDENKIQKQACFLETNKEFSMVCTSWKEYYQNTGKLTSNNGKRKELALYESQFGKECVNQLLLNKIGGIRDSSVCFRSDTYFDSFNEDPTLYTNKTYSCQDIQLIAEMLARGKLHLFNEDMVVYRILKDSASITRNIKKQVYFSYGIWLIELHLWNKYTLPIETLNHFTRNKLGGILKYAFIERDYRLAKNVKSEISRYPYQLRFSHHIMLLGSQYRFLHWIFQPILKIYDHFTNSKR